MKWQKITKISVNNHRNLEPDDCCYFYMVREKYDARNGWSEAGSRIANLKKKPSELAVRPDLVHYKKNAIDTFAADLQRLFEKGPKCVLVPAITSIPSTDSEFDDRLIQVVSKVEKSCPNVLMHNVLDVDERISSVSRGGGNRDDIEALCSHIVCTNDDFPTGFDWVFIVDDVITTGAHFKACQRTLERVFHIQGVRGLFWARAENSD